MNIKAYWAKQCIASIDSELTSGIESFKEYICLNKQISCQTCICITQVSIYQMMYLLQTSYINLHKIMIFIPDVQENGPVVRLKQILNRATYSLHIYHFLFTSLRLLHYVLYTVYSNWDNVLPLRVWCFILIKTTNSRKSTTNIPKTSTP